MTKSSMTELKKIRKTVASEFPNDPALQQVHIAQRLIARQAAPRINTRSRQINRSSSPIR